MRKPTFSIFLKTKAQISWVVNANLISIFVFATFDRISEDIIPQMKNLNSVIP